MTTSGSLETGMVAPRRPPTTVIPAPVPTWGEWFQGAVQGASNIVTTVASNAIGHFSTQAAQQQEDATDISADWVQVQTKGKKPDSAATSDTDALSTDWEETELEWNDKQKAAKFSISQTRVVDDRVWQKVQWAMLTEPVWETFFKEISDASLHTRGEIVEFFKLHANLGNPHAKTAYQLSSQKGYALAHTPAEAREL